MLTAAKMREIACAVEAVAVQRLRTYRRRWNLIAYEGIVLDRLCLHFVRKVWKENDYTVVCSIRPCMDVRLQEEVRRFAQEHHYPFVGYDGDCEIDRDAKRFVRVRCDNVSSAIQTHLHGRDGLLVLSGLLNGWSQRYFQSLNAEMQSFSVWADPRRPRRCGQRRRRGPP